MTTPDTTPTTRRGRRAASIDGPDPIDIHVGQRMRVRRTMLGKSQGQMARALGVSFPQVQKYERGANRISASRLFDVSRFLNVPVSYFFEDLTSDAVADRDAEVKTPVANANDPIPGIEDDPMKRTESLELIQAYWRRPEAERGALLALLHALSSGRYAPADQAAE